MIEYDQIVMESVEYAEKDSKKFVSPLQSSKSQSLESNKN